MSLAQTLHPNNMKALPLTSAELWFPWIQQVIHNSLSYITLGPPQNMSPQVIVNLEQKFVLGRKVISKLQKIESSR